MSEYNSSAEDSLSSWDWWGQESTGCITEKESAHCTEKTTELPSNASTYMPFPESAHLSQQRQSETFTVYPEAPSKIVPTLTGIDSPSSTDEVLKQPAHPAEDAITRDHILSLPEIESAANLNSHEIHESASANSPAERLTPENLPILQNENLIQKHEFVSLGNSSNLSVVEVGPEGASQSPTEQANSLCERIEQILLYRSQFNILVCSGIHENSLDVQIKESKSTVVVSSPDTTFTQELSELHQEFDEEFIRLSDSHDHVMISTAAILPPSFWTDADPEIPLFGNPLAEGPESFSSEEICRLLYGVPAIIQTILLDVQHNKSSFDWHRNDLQSIESGTKPPPDPGETISVHMKWLIKIIKYAGVLGIQICKFKYSNLQCIQISTLLFTLPAGFFIPTEGFARFSKSYLIFYSFRRLSVSFSKLEYRERLDDLFSKLEFERTSPFKQVQYQNRISASVPIPITSQQIVAVDNLIEQMSPLCTLIWRLLGEYLLILATHPPSERMFSTEASVAASKGPLRSLICDHVQISDQSSKALMEVVNFVSVTDYNEYYAASKEFSEKGPDLKSLFKFGPWSEFPQGLLY